MQILVVEDDEGVGNVLVQCLERWNEKVFQAPDGPAALKLLQGQAFDLLITDWALPGMTGTGLVRQLRRLPQYQTLPVLMISGRAEPPDVSEALRSGINGFLPKPFTPRQLKEKVEEVCQQQPLSPEKLEKVVQGKIGDPTNCENLVILGEPANTVQGLQRPERRGIAQYLIHLTEQINQANIADPTLQIGYTIQTSTQDLVTLIRRSSVQKVIKLVMVATDCVGDSYAFVRHLNRNRVNPFTTVLIHHAESFPPAARKELAQAGTVLIERLDLTPVVLETMINKFIIQKVKTELS